MVNDRFVLTREMREAAVGIGFPVADSILSQRQVYASAPGQGKVLWRMGSPARDAAIEMDVLFRELLPGVDNEHPSRIERLCAAVVRQRSSDQVGNEVKAIEANG